MGRDRLGALAADHDPTPLGVVGLAAFGVLPNVGGFLLWSVPALLLVGLCLATFYVGAVDPRLIIGRATLVGALGAAVLFLFSGLENVASSVLENRLSLPGYVSSPVAGGLAGLLVFPFRARFRRLAARVTPGD